MAARYFGILSARFLLSTVVAELLSRSAGAAPVTGQDRTGLLQGPSRDEGIELALRKSTHMCGGGACRSDPRAILALRDCSKGT
jgi:hypothetical protein